jgi:hypothetical protein
MATDYDTGDSRMDEIFTRLDEITYRIRRIESALIELQMKGPIFLGIGVNTELARQNGTYPPFWVKAPLDWTVPMINIPPGEL